MAGISRECMLQGKGKRGWEVLKVGTRLKAGVGKGGHGIGYVSKGGEARREGIGREVRENEGKAEPKGSSRKAIILKVSIKGEKRCAAHNR